MRTQGVRVAGAKPRNLIEILYPTDIPKVDTTFATVYKLFSQNTKPDPLIERPKSKRQLAKEAAEARRKQYLVAFPDKEKCRKCGKVKVQGEFHKNKTSSTGFDTTCKMCRNDLRKQKKLALIRGSKL